MVGNGLNGNYRMGGGVPQFLTPTAKHQGFAFSWMPIYRILFIFDGLY